MGQTSGRGLWLLTLTSLYGLIMKLGEKALDKASQATDSLNCSGLSVAQDIGLGMGTLL